MSNLPAYATNYGANQSPMSQSSPSVNSNTAYYPTVNQNNYNQNQQNQYQQPQQNFSQGQQNYSQPPPDYSQNQNFNQQNFSQGQQVQHSYSQPPPDYSQNQNFNQQNQFQQPPNYGNSPMAHSQPQIQPPYPMDPSMQYNPNMQQQGYHSGFPGGNAPPNMLASHSVPPQIPPQGFSPQTPNSPAHSISNSFFSQAPPTDPHKKANSYVVHWNKAVGLGCLATEKGHMSNGKGFPTYEISLFNVNEIFQGRMQGWNQKYPQAIKIFG